MVFTGLHPGEKLCEDLNHEAEQTEPTPTGRFVWCGIPSA
jgi:hypothetical protein